MLFDLAASSPDAKLELSGRCQCTRPQDEDALTALDVAAGLAVTVSEVRVVFGFSLCACVSQTTSASWPGTCTIVALFRKDRLQDDVVLRPAELDQCCRSVAQACLFFP